MLMPIHTLFHRHQLNKTNRGGIIGCKIDEFRDLGMFITGIDVAH